MVPDEYPLHVHLPAECVVLLPHSLLLVFTVLRFFSVCLCVFMSLCFSASLSPCLCSPVVCAWQGGGVVANSQAWYAAEAVTRAAYDEEGHRAVARCMASQFYN